jgi:hypothetical protein
VIEGPASPAEQRSTHASVLGMAVISVLAVVVSTELHECMHLVAGRLAGIPAHFLALTSVGIGAAEATHAPPWALAVMNGFAPIATMVIGLVALILVPVLRRRALVAVTAFAGWCAIFAVPYTGLQLMLTAAPVETRGNGADFAAVIGGYFGVPLEWRVAIAVIGLVVFLASGFVLRPLVSQVRESPRSLLSLTRPIRAISWWRSAMASALAALLIVIAARSATDLLHGNLRGISLLLRGAYVWAVIMTLLVPWRSVGARKVLKQWIYPGLLASAVLIIAGRAFNQDDFFTLGVLLVLPLPATALAASLIEPSASSEVFADGLARDSGEP